MELLLSDFRLYHSKSMVSGIIQKAMAIVDKEEVSKSSEEGSYFVKSYTQRLPHLVSTKSTRNIYATKLAKDTLTLDLVSTGQLKLQLPSHQRRLIKERLEEKSLF